MWILVLALFQADISHLMGASVMVKCGNMAGSGVVCLNKQGTYVITAKHVVTTKQAKIIQRLVKGLDYVGVLELDADVIKESTELDLCLLKVKKDGQFKHGVTFVKTVPALGTELLHIGSFYGWEGYNSLSSGIYSQYNRVKLYDQAIITICPGSSGGGVFLKDNSQCAGIVLKEVNGNVSLFMPARRVRDWVKID